MTQRYLSLLAGFFLISGTLLAQPAEELVPITARPQSDAPARFKKKTTASITLPFFDDFSYNQHYPDTALWEDAYVYINQTYAQSPPTLGVATFDGLNKDGLPYDISRLNTDSCDVLTSRAIDLSNTVDSVYLSFFWQAGGLGEHPENLDSLNLKFYNPQSKRWNRVWGISGVDSSGFNQAMVPVNGSQYLRDGFKFRFTSYGAPAGAFDTWNIDYVRMDDQRTKNDTAFKDPAFTRPHPSLLKSFEAVPWFHYNTQFQSIENKKAFFNIFYRRNVGPGSSYALDLGVFQISLGGSMIAGNPSGKGDIDNGDPDNVEIGFESPIVTIPGGDTGFVVPTPPQNEFNLMAYQTYKGLSSSEMTSNDTIVRHQIFKNYYALDDGSAERAYQVRDNRGGFVISKYDIAQADSIKGIYIYFLPSQYNIEDNQFSIVIFENNNNLPGNLIYESDSLYTPRYTSTNFLLPYQLDIPSGVWVTGPVFVGIRQVTNVRLPIGFDVNTPKRGKIYFGTNTPTGLYESFQEGNLMMRPYLRYQPKDLKLPDTEPQKIAVEIYPNPASDFIHIATTEPNAEYNFYLTNISGQLIQQGEVNDGIRLAPNVDSGIYLLRLQDPTGKKAPVVKKILVKR